MSSSWLFHLVRLAGIAFLAGAANGCSDSASPAVELPSDWKLRASASGVVDELTITCTLDFAGSFRKLDSEYRGSMGGMIERKVLQPDESGIAFWADASYPDLRLEFDGDAVTIRAWLDGAPFLPTGESRFWDEILVFHGVLDRQTNTISGEWVCRPIDARGDDRGEIVGTWSITP